MDFDASPVIAGTKSIEKMGKELLEEIIAVANGKVVKAEALGFNDIAISRVCNYV
ncbi:UxaA family hydrolase [Clostridium arbusti]|uniref:UxaA family hydrolase n=1 Tax=Clostridium arbusti TaxID=1137848 RepID=UPI000304C0AE|nr:UxaA family hydrolase [Clostridium arbusti]